MDNFNETKNTWNKLANLYQERFMDLNIYNESYDLFIEKLLTKNSNILEIGCGPGNISKYLLSKNPNLNILGIDYSTNMVELAKINNPNAKYNVLDCRNLETINQKFNGIICGFCLPYLTPVECEKLILDCYLLLNTKGIIYLSFVEGNPLSSTFQTNSLGNRVFFNFHDLKLIIDLLEKFKFKETIVSKVDFKRSEKENETHTIIISRKTD
ncbi:MAG: methyltransferase domain-containing protein [Bacteroidetes bacterium]|nr:methyltransferase domain-containing protein [Bacteroidota bacterium]